MAVTSIKIALLICGLATLEATVDTEMIKKLRKQNFDMMDLNKDGKLSVVEFTKDFDLLDVNIQDTSTKSAVNVKKNVHVNVTTKLRRTYIPVWVQIKDKGLSLAEMTEAFHFKDIPEYVKKEFMLYDEADGKVDEKMERSGIGKYFDKYDTDGDGELSFEESIGPLKKALGENE